MEDKTMCGISEIIKVTGMKRKDILRHIETGKIKAEMRGRYFVFEIAEKERLETLCSRYIGFFYLVQKYDIGTSGFRFEIRKCRDELVEFAAENSWFGADILSAEDVFFTDASREVYFVRKTDELRFAPHIRLWLKSYGETAVGKLRLISGRLRELYPETGMLLRKFIAKEYPHDHTAAWILTDFLCSTLNCEITRSDEETLDSIAAAMDKELPLNSARMFAAFLAYLRSKRKLGNGWSYQFKQRSESRSKNAYPISAYFKMAYIVFNEDAWAAERLKEKALQSEAYANLWLFVALHFTCGWRGSDIVRLPMPKLPCGGEAVREQLAAGIFDTDSLAEEIELRLRYTPMKPKKTGNFNVPELKLFIAESLRKPLGFILSVAASYHENVPPGGAFIRRAGSFMEIQAFFGMDFVSACENKGFSTRRANKSYLQGIESSAVNTPGKPKGYMLAAIARSHKSGYGALPQTTEIYLRDARFSGYSPEFIAREMFERGVFSFIPALLLDMHEGKYYGKLPVHAQTKLIAEIGITPSGIEEIASMVQSTLDKARHAIAEIMAHPSEMRESVENMLQNIASGNAPGRQGGFLCLMTAAGLGCMDIDRSCCIGCGFEIYTKTILRLLMAEYSRLVEKKKSAEKSEAARLEGILKKAVLPAVCEILSSAERLYPDLDMKPLTDELERGLRLC